METALLLLVLHIATALLAHIPENFTENPFQGVIGNFTTLRTFRVLNGLVSVVADVHGRAIEVA